MSKVSTFLAKQFSDNFVYASEDGTWTFNHDFYSIFKGNKRIKKKKARRAVHSIIEHVILPHAREVVREGRKIDE